jgi:hypothetical protein
MISDTLSDAVAAIRKDLDEKADWYVAYRDEIEKVVAAMEALRIKLDTPPSED